MTITTSPPPIYHGLKEYTKSDAFFFSVGGGPRPLFFFFFFGVLFPFLFVPSFLSFFLSFRTMDDNKSKNLKGKRSRRGKNRGPERERFLKRRKERDR